jgi:predicted small metal-binding protein
MTCGFETSAPTKEELMQKISAHAASVHNIKTVSPELNEKIQKAIREEPAKH